MNIMKFTVLFILDELESAPYWTKQESAVLWCCVFCFFYLVVDGDLRVGVSFVERFHFAEMMFQRQLHHPEQHGDVCRQRLELQLPAHRLV